MAKRPGQIRRVRLPLWAGWLSWVLTVVVLAAAVGFAVGPLARAQGWTTDGGSPTVDPQIIADIHSDPSGNGVIGAASEPNYHGVSADRIADVIAATQPTLAGSYGGAIADLDGAGLSYEFSAHTPLTPASTLKVMTATAITDALGADHSFTTSVVATSADAIVLVGGGDPLLASTPTSYSGSSAIALPTTADLAARTAAALQARASAGSASATTIRCSADRSGTPTGPRVIASSWRRSARWSSTKEPRYPAPNPAPR